jgi:hypothetical protein
MTLNNIISYIINLLLAIIGFFLVTSFNNTNKQLLEINKDIISLRLEITELKSQMMTDDRVREIFHLEMGR